MLNYCDQFKPVSASLGVQGASFGEGNECVSKRPQILRKIRCLLSGPFTANSWLVNREGSDGGLDYQEKANLQMQARH